LDAFFLSFSEKNVSRHFVAIIENQLFWWYKLILDTKIYVRRRAIMEKNNLPVDEAAGLVTRIIEQIKGAKGAAFTYGNIRKYQAQAGIGHTGAKFNRTEWECAWRTVLDMPDIKILCGSGLHASVYYLPGAKDATKNGKNGKIIQPAVDMTPVIEAQPPAAKQESAPTVAVPARRPLVEKRQPTVKTKRAVVTKKDHVILSGVQVTWEGTIPLTLSLEKGQTIQVEQHNRDGESLGMFTLNGPCTITLKKVIRE